VLKTDGLMTRMSDSESAGPSLSYVGLGVRVTQAYPGSSATVTGPGHAVGRGRGYY
jgi:hypothetical protein